MINGRRVSNHFFTSLVILGLRIRNTEKTHAIVTFCFSFPFLFIEALEFLRNLFLHISSPAIGLESQFQASHLSHHIKVPRMFVRYGRQQVFRITTQKDGLLSRLATK